MRGGIWLADIAGWAAFLQRDLTPHLSHLDTPVVHTPLHKVLSESKPRALQHLVASQSSRKPAAARRRAASRRGACRTNPLISSKKVVVFGSLLARRAV